MPDYNPDIDYYEILQVHSTAHQEVIKRAYRTVIGLLQAHPDLGGSHEDAVRVNEAYKVLSNPEMRKAYDNERKMQVDPLGFRVRRRVVDLVLFAGAIVM